MTSSPHGFVRFHQEWLRRLEKNSELKGSLIIPDDRFESILPNFCRRYYGKDADRILVVGINPGRKGSGVTGVPFTDGSNLDRLGIDDRYKERRELTSQFVYEVIEAFGGEQDFYDRFLLGSALPIGFAGEGINANYYDLQPDGFWTEFLALSLAEQKRLAGNHAGPLVVIGKGKNLKAILAVNRSVGLFSEVIALDHPRYIMQYNRSKSDSYVAEYVATLRRAYGAIRSS